jgi:putative hydrolase of the HAD superfamily
MHDVYETILQAIVGEEVRSFPRDVGVVRDLARSVGAAISRSYEARELEELDMMSLFEERLAELGHPLPRSLVRRIVQLEHQALTSNLVMTDENLQVLRTLKSWGLRLGIVSNITFVPELLQADMDRLGIGEYIDVPVYSSAFGLRKPHPSIFLHVLQGLGVQPDEALFVGDRLNDDIAGAKAVGMRTALTREYRQEDPGYGGIVPEVVVERLPDLLPYVKQRIGDTFSGKSASPIAE